MVCFILDFGAIFKLALVLVVGIVLLPSVCEDVVMALNNRHRKGCTGLCRMIIVAQVKSECYIGKLVWYVNCYVVIGVVRCFRFNTRTAINAAHEPFAANLT